MPPNGGMNRRNGAISHSVHTYDHRIHFEPESHGSRLRWQDIPKNVLHDQIAIFTSPLHINRGNAKWWIAFGGGTAALIATDQAVSNSLPQETRLTKSSQWASRLGSSYFLYPAWATFYVVGKAGEGKFLKRGQCATA